MKENRKNFYFYVRACVDTSVGRVPEPSITQKRASLLLLDAQIRMCVFGKEYIACCFQHDLRAWSQISSVEQANMFLVSSLCVYVWWWYIFVSYKYIGLLHFGR